MIFKNKHNNKPDLHFRIEIDDKHIEKVEVTKFLGVLIDNNLSWKAHTNHITKIVSKYNGIIRKVRPFLNKESLHTLYNTLVLPYLTYCTLVWGDKNNANLDSLFITQKKVIRRVHHIGTHHAFRVESIVTYHGIYRKRCIT